MARSLPIFVEVDSCCFNLKRTKTTWDKSCLHHLSMLSWLRLLIVFGHAPKALHHYMWLQNINVFHWRFVCVCVSYALPVFWCCRCFTVGWGGRIQRGRTLEVWRVGKLSVFWRIEPSCFSKRAKIVFQPPLSAGINTMFQSCYFEDNVTSWFCNEQLK